MEIQEKREIVRGKKLDNDQKELELNKIIESIDESSRNMKIAPIDSNIIQYKAIIAPTQ